MQIRISPATSVVDSSENWKIRGGSCPDHRDPGALSREAGLTKRWLPKTFRWSQPDTSRYQRAASRQLHPWRGNFRPCGAGDPYPELTPIRSGITSCMALSRKQIPHPEEMVQRSSPIGPAASEAAPPGRSARSPGAAWPASCPQTACGGEEGSKPLRRFRSAQWLALTDP